VQSEGYGAVGDKRKISVAVVDDSALVRSLLSDIINRQTDMVCIGTAADPFAARELIRSLNPDVITLDVEMPRMDGISFLERLMRLRPMPVIMVSTLTERAAEVTLRALELGAVDFVAKPRVGVADGLQKLADDITEKIRMASKARVIKQLTFDRGAFAPAESSSRAMAVMPATRPLTMVTPTAVLPPRSSTFTTAKVIFIGASTGGTEATRELLAELPEDSPPILITQHMPAGYTRNYARRLDSLTLIRVKEAEHQERLAPGHAYIAPGGRHLRIGRGGGSLVALLSDEDPVNRHRPSVEVLFESAARVVGPNALGIMLTGMGGDGAQAMRLMKDEGAYNIAQSEDTCVVFGMPREAIRHEAVHDVLPLKAIASHVLDILRHPAAAQAR
jgi:two-component system chemotaxis response regulator CheB